LCLEYKDSSNAHIPPCSDHFLTTDANFTVLWHAICLDYCWSTHLRRNSKTSKKQARPRIFGRRMAFYVCSTAAEDANSTSPLLYCDEIRIHATTPSMCKSNVTNFLELVMMMGTFMHIHRTPKYVFADIPCIGVFIV